MIHSSITSFQLADSYVIHPNTRNPKPLDCDIMSSVPKPIVHNLRNAISPYSAQPVKCKASYRYSQVLKSSNSIRIAAVRFKYQM